MNDIESKPEYPSPYDCLNIKQASQTVTQFHEKVLKLLNLGEEEM